MPETPVFIGGLMKSGTSLLRKLVSEHPNIFGGLETFWFSEEFTSQWQDADSKRQKWLREFYEVSLEDYLKIQASASSPSDFLNQFLHYCTHKEGKQRWVEKTPDNILHLDKIWAHWPEAKIIHVLRDPRDVYASWKRNKKRSLEFFLSQLKEIATKVPPEKDHNKNNYLEIRYEKLTKDTEKCLEEVFEFLQEPIIASIAEYQGDNAADFDKLLQVTGKESATAVSLSKPIFSSSIGQWKEILDQNEVQAILEEGKMYLDTFQIKLDDL